MSNLRSTTAAAALLTAAPFDPPETRFAEGAFRTFMRGVEISPVERRPSEFATRAEIDSVNRMTWAMIDAARASAAAEFERVLGFQPQCHRIYAAPFFARAPKPRAAVTAWPMHEADLSALVAAEARRISRNARRAANDRRARIGKAMQSPVSARAKFDAAEAARRARNGGAGGLGR